MDNYRTATETSRSAATQLKRQIRDKQARLTERLVAAMPLSLLQEIARLKQRLASDAAEDLVLLEQLSSQLDRALEQISEIRQVSNVPPTLGWFLDRFSTEGDPRLDHSLMQSAQAMDSLIQQDSELLHRSCLGDGKTTALSRRYRKQGTPFHLVYQRPNTMDASSEVNGYVLLGTTVSSSMPTFRVQPREMHSLPRYIKSVMDTYEEDQDAFFDNNYLIVRTDDTVLALLPHQQKVRIMRLALLCPVWLSVEPGLAHLSLNVRLQPRFIRTMEQILNELRSCFE